MPVDTSRKPYSRPSDKKSQRPARGAQRAPVTESEDEAYGGSPASDSEDFIPIDEENLSPDSSEAPPTSGRTDNSNRLEEIDETSEQLEAEMTQMERDAEADESLKVQQKSNRKVSPRKGPGAASQGTRTSNNKPPAGRGRGANTPRRVINGRTNGTDSRSSMTKNGNSQPADDTYGDEERKCVKSFKEAYNTLIKKRDVSTMPIEQEVQHLLALADVYQKSAINSVNIYNLLRASGLYNLCLRKLEGRNETLYKQIKHMLLSFEDNAMKRVLKIKSTQYHFFAHDAKKREHLDDLKEIRDLCRADFKCLTENLKDFPSSNSILEHRKASERISRAEDNVIACSSLLHGEVAERIRSLLARIFAECIDLQGTAPCAYTLIGNHSFGAKVISPFEPVSLFLVIEKDSAPARLYFRSTIALFGMKIINIGETSLSLLNIRSLNWFPGTNQPSGFSLAGYIDIYDQESRNFSTVPLDCIKTPKELQKLAVSDKLDIRLSLIQLTQNMTFITGDLKLFKETLPIRNAVLNREQTEKPYKKRFFESLQNLADSIDPVVLRSLEQSPSERGCEDQTSLFNVVTSFLDHFTEVEKTLVAESTFNKLEEMMPSGSSVTYSDVTIQSEVRGTEVCSTISTRLSTPRTPTPSPEPIKLPEILVPVKKKTTTTWHIDEEEKRIKSPVTDNSNALRKLKEKKQTKHSEYSQKYNNKKCTEIFATDLALAGSRSVSKNTSAETGSMISSSTNSTEKKSLKEKATTWAKPKPIKPPKIRPVTPPHPTPQPIERFVYITPVYDGRQKGLISAESARNLALLHAITSCEKVKHASENNLIATNHENAFKIDEKVNEAAYNKLLHVVVSITSMIRQTLSGELAINNLKKAVLSSDMRPDDDEFIVALAFYQTGRYVQCCRAAHKYLENHSDITFVGEPFPADFTEVCSELQEDNIITMSRLISLHMMMGFSHMRRGNLDEAMSYFTEILPRTSKLETKASLYKVMTECCMRLKRRDDARKALNRCVSLYTDLYTKHPLKQHKISLDQVTAMQEEYKLT